jgi:hypothetical protein
MAASEDRRAYMHARANAWADQIIHALRSACLAIEAVGQIRLAIGHVSRIDVLAVPKPRRLMFGGRDPDLTELDLALSRMGGELEGYRREDGRHCAIHRVSRLPVVIHELLDGGEWAVGLALRTGPPVLADEMAQRARTRGLSLEGDRVTVTGPPASHEFMRGPLPLGNEQRLFRVLGLPYRRPEDRSKPWPVGR